MQLVSLLDSLTFLGLTIILGITQISLLVILREDWVC